MADEKAVQAIDSSPEEVAYKLMGLIHHLEGPSVKRDRKYILDLYAECLVTIQNPGGRVSQRRS